MDDSEWKPFLIGLALILASGFFLALGTNWQTALGIILLAFVIKN